MDQQCSAIVKHIIKRFSCLPTALTYALTPQPKSLLINHLINNSLLDV